MLPKVLKIENLSKSFVALKKAVDNNESSTVLSCADEPKQFIIGQLDKFFLYILPDHLNARKTAENLSEIVDGDVAFLNENDDILIFNKINRLLTLPSRIELLLNLCTNNLKGIVITAQGLTQLLPNKKKFDDNIIEIALAEEYELYEIVEKLVNGGYVRDEFLDNKGTFRIIGDSLEIYSLTEELPFKIEFDFNKVEKIKIFSPDSMVTIKTINRCVIAPSRDILLNDEDKELLKKKLINTQKKAKQTLYDIIEQILEVIDTPDFIPNNWILPFIKNSMSSIFDYLPENTVIYFDEPKIIDDKLKHYYEITKSRVEDFYNGGTNIKEHIDSILSIVEIKKAFERYTKVAFMADNSLNTIFETKNTFTIKGLPITRYTFNLAQLFTDIKNYSMNGTTVFICFKNTDSAEIFKNNLKENGIASEIYKDNLSNIEKYSLVSLLVTTVNTSFYFPSEKIAFIGNDKISARVEKRVKTEKEKRQVFILPECGDYVVHDVHGIGISEGIKKVETVNGCKEFYVIKYREEDRLYLPVDQMDHIEKYSGKENPALHRLGSKDFERVKQRVKNAIKEIAIDLLALYEKRLNQKGYKFPEDTPFQKDMENLFEFTETEDQLTAIEEIKKDMEKGKIMDRLLCGDVGFGKTEVAIRAIFKTIMENKQVAVLAPTTILSNQHYNTMKARLNEFGIEIVLLNRFVPQHIIEKNMVKISTGKAKIVIGTHRILSQDVIFEDLGLLVIDEEQKFGVVHKEKIKSLKTNVNVLSLSATPIPRTLHMSLTGIRDISVLDTPPLNRLPIQTYLVEYTDSLVIDAVKREVARGGQVYILYNRVKGIVDYTEHIANLLGSEITVIYAHGQMEANELEERINLFYNNEAQVLVSTTIIENGIDLPNANTLIVINSERFGLSQLYQIRGRVGRSNIQAYSYFTYPDNKNISEDAMKRLDALNTYTELGSGFKIAMVDMNIRGSGNVLGSEQSGEMEKVGYDLYCKLLSETINEIKGIQNIKKLDVEIEIEGDSNLPERYILKQSDRIKFYKRVAILENTEKRKEILRDLEDMYYHIPDSVLLLINIGLIKNLAQGINIKKVIITKKVFSVQFYNNDMFKNANLFNAMNKYKTDVVLLPIACPILNFADKNASPLEKTDFLIDFLERSQLDNKN